MPSQKNAKAGPSSSKARKSGSSSDEQEVSTSTQATEEHLEEIQTGLNSLVQQLKTLREQNAKLRSELNAAKTISRTKNSGKERLEAASDDDDVDLAELRLRKLEKAVKHLTNENDKHKQRIRKFKDKELDEELKNLGPPNGSDAELSEMDSKARMRKLLRKFSDLMLVTTIPEDDSEICPICSKTFKIGRCSALECGHIFCHECLLQIPSTPDETIKCPECRRFTDRDQLELVHMTDENRWDELSAVAKAWDAFDRRAEQESSEEEAEENFINDETDTSEPTEATAITDNDDTSSKASTPPPVSGRLFSESPTKEKRKRMEQLAEQRAKKRRR